MSFLNELKRRNVLRVGAAYIVAAWLIIQVVETIFPAFGFGDAAVRIATIVLGIGLVPTLILAWAFELTPEGLKRDADVVRDDSITQTTGKKLDRIILVVLALALGYFAFDKFVLDPARDAELVEETTQKVRTDVLVESYGDKSIAVLPFVNMSSDPEQEYFSDGISDELLNLLAQIPELRVISRSSAFSFKGKDIPIPTVAKQLNVVHVLEGSVRKSGNRVRITAQLIEARSDSHLWSQTYDRELGDIFAIQKEIATAIGTALKLELFSDEGETMQFSGMESANSAAYDAFLKGRELIYLRSDLDQAVEHLGRSLRLDNNFAPAHAQLGIAIALTLADGLSLVPEEDKRTAILHLDRALELEPDLAEAHGGRAVLALTAGDAESAIEHARKALASNPSYTDAMNWLANGLRNLGHYEEAGPTYEQILVTDPLNIVGRINYAMWLSLQGRFDEAHEMADQLLVQDPEGGYQVHAETSIFFEGELAEGLSWSLKLGKELGHAIAFSKVAFVRGGVYDEARRNIEVRNHWVDVAEGHWDEAIRATQEIMNEAPDNVYFIRNAAGVLYLAGRIDEALPLYERVVDSVPEGRPIAAYWPIVQTMWLALARRQAGDGDGAQAAAQIARQDFAARRAAGFKNPDLYHAEAVIAAYDHDPDGVIAALESSIKLGLRDPRVFRDPIFEDMRDEPRFVALQQELDTILIVEHEKVLQLICFNNPVPDDWQPLPETCEGVEQQHGL